MAFLGKYFIVRICFLKMQLYLCIYLFLYFSIHIFFFILLFFSAKKTFKVLVWISSIKLRELLDAQLTSCWMVEGLIHTGSFGKQSLSLFRGNTAFQGNRRCNFSHFLDMVKTGLLFTSFSLKWTANYENRELNIPFGLNEIYAIWTVHFRRCEFFDNYYFNFLNFYL